MASIGDEVNPGSVVWLMDILRDLMHDPLISDLARQVEGEGLGIDIEFVENGTSRPVDESRIYLVRAGGKEIGDSSPCDRLVNVLRLIARNPLVADIIRDVEEEGFDVCVEFAKKEQFDERRIHLVRRPRQGLPA